MLSFGITITQGSSIGISILTAQKTYRITIPVTLHMSVRFFFFLNAANISIRALPHRMLITTEKNVIFISFNYSRSFAIIPSSSFISFSFSSGSSLPRSDPVIATAISPRELLLNPLSNNTTAAYSSFVIAGSNCLA